jgi:hypothetical protein
MELAQDRVQWRALVFSGVEPSDSASRELISKMDLGKKLIVRMGGGWNWLKIVSSGKLWYYRC